jgi:hypothetical protein
MEVGFDGNAISLKSKIMYYFDCQSSAPMAGACIVPAQARRFAFGQLLPFDSTRACRFFPLNETTFEVNLKSTWLFSCAYSAPASATEPCSS